MTSVVPGGKTITMRDGFCLIMDSDVRLRTEGKVLIVRPDPAEVMAGVDHDGKPKVAKKNSRGGENLPFGISGMTSSFPRTAANLMRLAGLASYGVFRVGGCRVANSTAITYVEGKEVHLKCYPSTSIGSCDHVTWKGYASSELPLDSSDCQPIGSSYGIDYGFNTTYEICSIRDLCFKFSNKLFQMYSCFCHDTGDPISVYCVDKSPTAPSDGFDHGAIAGIVIALFLFLVLVGVLMYGVYSYRKKKWLFVCGRQEEAGAKLAGGPV